MCPKITIQALSTDDKSPDKQPSEVSVWVSTYTQLIIIINHFIFYVQMLRFSHENSKFLL